MRNAKPFLSIAYGFLLLCHTVCAEEPADLRLFLLIGQSNMAGRGKVTPADGQTHPRLFMLDKANAWVPAKDPVHFDKPTIAGVGLGSEFARCVAAEAPDAKVGLIPCAFGGTRLDQWKPGTALYSNAVARTRLAMKSGRLQAILWHQGEGDCAPEKIATYPARFSAMIGSLRQDVGAPDVPVIVGELGRFRGTYAAFNAMLPQVTRAVPRSARVSSEGLGANPDNVHFSRDALIEFGKRYFAAYQKMRKECAER
ncbi:MAG: sialate O-acetylesterase [Kiritimatiellia bacterium]|jgi:hypothetical protein|nr:sialate O-acetylesterase [Kiritimatiellia bacterium]